MNKSAVIECPQLFQGFHPFGGGRQPGNKLTEHTGTITIDANVPEIADAIRKVHVLGSSPRWPEVPGPGNRCPTEIMSHAPGIEDHFHNIGVEHLAGIVNPLAQCCDGGLLVLFKVIGNLINQFRRYQRLVPLNVDHAMIRIQLQLPRHFFKAVCATGMMGRGHDDFCTKTKTRLLDTGIVGRDHHAAGAALIRPLADMLDHRLAGNHGQRFAGQTTGSVSSGNDNGK